MVATSTWRSTAALRAQTAAHSPPWEGLNSCPLSWMPLVWPTLTSDPPSQHTSSVASSLNLEETTVSRSNVVILLCKPFAFISKCVALFVASLISQPICPALLLLCSALQALLRGQVSSRDRSSVTRLLRWPSESARGLGVGPGARHKAATESVESKTLLDDISSLIY